VIKSYLYIDGEKNVLEDIDLSQKDLHLVQPTNLLWIDIYDCSSHDLNYLGELFNFHPLAIEDCLQVSPRAKVDNYKDYFFFVFHALRYDEESEDEIYTAELDVFLGPNYLVTIHKTSLPTVARVVKQCLRSSELMERGPDYLLYNIIDGIVDETFPILEQIGQRIDDLEDEIYINPAREITEEILALKRTILLLRKVVIPQKRIFANVNGRYSFQIHDDNKPYYLDLVDLLERITDSADTYRDLVTSAMETYHSVVSNRTNDVIRVLTIISTIILPLTFITGLFGMNVPIPFQTNPIEFWSILIGSLGLIFAMLGWFRKKGWL